MAGRAGVIGEFTGIGTTQDINCGPAVGNATWRRAQFYIDTTDITPAGGSFDVTLSYKTPGGEVIQIAQLNTINSTGMVEMAILAAFGANEDIIPEPSQMELVRNGSAVDFEAKVYMFAG